MINKDTKIYGSFSKTAGNKGCEFFNKAFKKYNINAIYKSFSVQNIEETVRAAKCLNFSGFAVSMPYKKQILEYVELAPSCPSIIGAINTVVNRDGQFLGHNTDYLAAKEFMSRYNRSCVIILGNGGYASAVKYAANRLNMNYKTITRKNWQEIFNLQGELIYNCTPIENIKVPVSNEYIDCITNTETGKELSLIQAKYQFEIYTGLPYDPN